MTKSEYAVFTKMKHWGLITKLEDGLWVITDHGLNFLKNVIRIPKEIEYFRDKVIRESDKKIAAVEILRTVESKQKYREMMGLP